MRIEYHQPTAKVHLVTDHGLIHEIPCEVLQIAQQQFGKVLLDIRVAVEPVEKLAEAEFGSFETAIASRLKDTISEIKADIRKEWQELLGHTASSATEVRLDNRGSDVSSNSAASADLGGVPGSGAAGDDSQGVQK